MHKLHWSFNGLFVFYCPEDGNDLKETWLANRFEVGICKLKKKSI